MEKVRGLSRVLREGFVDLKPMVVKKEEKEEKEREEAMNRGKDEAKEEIKEAAMTREKEIIAANAGDSRAVLCRAGCEFLVAYIDSRIILCYFGQFQGVAGIAWRSAGLV